MNIRPIRTDKDHASALAEIERLWGADQGTEDGDRLDVLATLVEAYEEKRWAVPYADPIEVIEFALTDMGRSQAELARLLGSRPRATEILKRKRSLTVPMIHKLSSEWRIPAEALVRPYHLDTDAQPKLASRRKQDA